MPSVGYWSEDILKWSETYSVPSDLSAVVMQIESCGDPGAVSGAGAIGLFQVMPYHFEETEDPFNPEVNAMRGLLYLSVALEKASGDEALALAGYNGGHSVISRDPSHWADETRRYVYWGTGILTDVRAGLSESPTLEEWLNAGGASLCRKAESSLNLVE